MYNKFIEYIEKEKLFASDDKILIAASGGKDSMALINLLVKAKYSVGVAHFNHITRKGESDRDQKFISDYCKEKGLPFYTTSVNIKQLLEKGQGNNFQDLARNKRYEWLEQVRDENKYDFIATAHHKNDNVETFLYKVAKGAGVKGLSGIKSKNGNVVRPMLNIFRSEINNYVEQNEIPFVEDSSNNSDDYDRNFIRHNIIPAFEQLHPNFVNRISVSIENLKELDKQFDFLLDAFSAKYICRKKGWIIISKSILDKVPYKTGFLFFLIQKYDFNKSQVLDIVNSVDSVGALFYSESYELLIDRVSFIIKNRKNDKSCVFNVSLGENILEGYGTLRLKIVDNNSLTFSENVRYMDVSALNFPLSLRCWKNGDTFKPFGLKGKSKKLKDYFTKKKLSRFEKNNTLLMLNGEDICMILGDDISYDYRVKISNEKVLEVMFSPVD